MGSMLLLSLSEAASSPWKIQLGFPTRPRLLPTWCRVEPFLLKSSHCNSFLSTPAAPCRLEVSKLQTLTQPASRPWK